MRREIGGISIAVLAVLVALGAWLFPFRPIGQSPFDKMSQHSPSPATEDNPKREQTGQDAERPPQRREVEAVIDDPDGYTNVRSGPRIQSKIVCTIDDGEVFYVTSTLGQWWQVKTKDGKYGYMHRSRIKIRT